MWRDSICPEPLEAAREGASMSVLSVEAKKMALGDLLSRCKEAGGYKLSAPPHPEFQSDAVSHSDGKPGPVER